MQVEIFSTNINSSKQANIIIGLIHLCFPHLSAHVDLFDSDHVLRIETNHGRLNPYEISQYIQTLGFKAQLIK
ncbi:hypothetical protein [Fulvivirga lutea]|uniref:Uncharacterized protein n=1 Tax=Fulvivirga lutea TaxID=2810512 RepID=A0A974WL23_9BACT|nr:hypothetical protein [Fulvivirga lutea]QSE97338.1 hypothetical protein JR347_17410 [Fulvivirga lutea]